MRQDFRPSRITVFGGTSGRAAHGDERRKQTSAVGVVCFCASKMAIERARCSLKMSIRTAMGLLLFNVWISIFSQLLIAAPFSVHR